MSLARVGAKGYAWTVQVGYTGSVQRAPTTIQLARTMSHLAPTTKGPCTDHNPEFPAYNVS